MRLTKLSLIIMLFAVLLQSGSEETRASAPPCALNIRFPRTPNGWCGETIVTHDYSPGIASLSAMTLAPDGSLYYARPATREIMRVSPDDNGFIIAPYPEPQVFASELPEPPNGVTYHESAWYVSGDTSIVRLRDTDGDNRSDEQTVIVDDLPGGAGGWLGNIRVGPDERLYVAKAASCDACIEIDPRRAALLSFALDGSEPRIVAKGLRDSYDFDWHPITKTLYIVDNERSILPAELNAIPSTESNEIIESVDFGWPRCDAMGFPLSGYTEKDCENTVKPVMLFPAGSHPAGVAFYTHSAFNNQLLVMLHGGWNQTEITGHLMLGIQFNQQNVPTGIEVIIPDLKNSGYTLADAALYLVSFYPHRPVSIAVDHQGWIYFAVSEGRIYRIRPYL